MLRKEIAGHFGLTLVWLLVITSLHFDWRGNLVWFWLGGLVGTFLLDLEKFFFEPPFLLSSQKPPFRNILFQAGLLIAAFYVITSSASFLGKGLVMAMSLRLLRELLQSPAAFFWPLKIEITAYQQRLVVITMILVFLGLNLLLV